MFQLPPLEIILMLTELAANCTMEAQKTSQFHGAIDVCEVGVREQYRVQGPQFC